MATRVKVRGRFVPKGTAKGRKVKVNNLKLAKPRRRRRGRLV